MKTSSSLNKEVEMKNCQGGMNPTCSTNVVSRRKEKNYLCVPSQMNTRNMTNISSCDQTIPPDYSKYHYPPQNCWLSGSGNISNLTQINPQQSYTIPRSTYESPHAPDSFDFGSIALQSQPKRREQPVDRGTSFPSADDFLIYTTYCSQANDLQSSQVTAPTESNQAQWPSSNHSFSNHWKSSQTTALVQGNEEMFPSTACGQVSSQCSQQESSKRRPKLKRPRLCHFILELLDNPQQYSNIVEWVDKENGVFKFLNSSAVAAHWGRRRDKPNMKYENFARSLRTYIAKGIMTKPRSKLVYRFTNKVL